jgi:non-haem dioxygenase in morphine synthesis N-terminal
MSQTATATQLADPLTIKLQNGQVFRVESNESVEAEVIPIIDVSGMFSEKLEDRKAVAEKIREACHRIGFFYVVNHV